MKQFIISALALFLLSCSSDQAEIPKTGNDTLNTLLESAPYSSIVQIGNASVDTVFADRSNMITPQIEESQTILGRVSGLTSINNTVYIADQQNATVWEINEESGNIRTIGRSGAGPGEFQLLMDIKNNSSSIFSVEPSKIQQFSRDMTYENELSQVVYQEKLAVSDSHLFIPLNPYTGDELIQVREATFPFVEVARIMPPIIPRGLQPASYNSVEIAANKNGYFVAAYHGLPYLFIFDSEFNIEHTLYIQLIEDEGNDNPSPEPVNSSEAMRVSAFITNLNILDDNSIYFTYSMDLFKLVPSGDNYRFDEAVHFTFADSDKREETPWGLQPTSLHVQNGTITIGSIFEESIYRFKWEEM